MQKIIVAMIIGAGLGAALTHGIMSRRLEVAQLSAAASGDPVPSESLAPAADRSSSGAAGMRYAVGNAVPQAANAPVVRMQSGEIAAAASLDGAPATAAPVETAAVNAEIEQAVSFQQALGIALGYSQSDPAGRAALRQVVDRWFSESPSEVITAVDRISDPGQRGRYLAALARAAVVEQPERLAEIMTHMRGMNEQGAIVNGVMQAVRDVAEPESLLPAAQMLPGMLGRAVEQMIYSQVASRDPLDALARADQLPPGETRRMLTSQAIVQLASSDPAGALAWLGAQQSRLDSNDWVSVAAVLSGQNPSLAAEYAPSVPESARGEWISAVARGMAARDVDGALSWLGTYRNTDYYDAAVAGVAQQLVSYDPQRAAQLLGDIDVDSPMAQAAVTGVAAMWAASDEDGAIDWATDLPRGDTRDRALIALAPRIGERLLDDAMLDLFSNEPVRNSAAGAAITAVARTDPARAQDLVNTHISNPQLAQEIGAIIENGGQGGRVATFMLAPGAAGAAPAGGTFIYSDVAAPLPQFTVRSDVNTVILRGPETEQ